MNAPVNLLPASRREAQRIRRRARAWSVVTLAYLAGIGTLWGVLASGPAASSAAEALANIAVRTDARATEIKGLRAAIFAAQSQTALSQSVQDHPDWSRLLDLLASARGQDVAIERLALVSRAASAPQSKGKPKAADLPDRGPWTLNIAGIAATQRDATDFVAGLEILGIFERVSLAETRERAEAGAGQVALVDFTVNCELSDRPAAPTDKAP